MIFKRRVTAEEAERIREKVQKDIERINKSKEIKRLKAQYRAEAQPAKAVMASVQDLAQQTPPNLNEEQKIMTELFGQGQHIWGLPEEESGTKVKLHRTLYSGQTDTSSLFGFGERRSRSLLY